MEASKKVLFIRNWISNYIDSMPSKAESLVIGISGGIDSSVSSTLSAMTGLRTIVLSMPIKQKSNQHDLSQKHLEWLRPLDHLTRATKGFEAGLDYMMRRNHSSDLPQFKDTMQRMDNIRDENIIETFPELAELYETD